MLRQQRRLLGAVARHPELWPTAVRAAVRLAPRRWWTHAPFLPLPDSAYLRFRIQTHTGNPEGTPSHEDVVRYLRWCRDNVSAFT